jgi:hypothetical protein
MRRCVQCGRDYPEPQDFCLQCGEHLLSTPAPAAPERPDASHLRARAISRRRAPGRSQSLVFASLVLVGAFAGLALVWRQVWLPSMPRLTASLSRESEPRAPSSNVPPAPVAAAPATATAPSAPAAPPEPEPSAAVGAPAAAAAPPRVTASPSPVTTPSPSATTAPAAARGLDAAPPAPAPTPPKRAAEPAPPPRKVASHPDPAPAPAADRPAPPKLLSARTDPDGAVPMGRTRVIALVPVGPASGARGQLQWEPMGGGTLVVSGLPQPPAGRTYQLWLGSINLGNRVSAGLLAVDAQGAGTLRVPAPRSTWAPDIFGITMERQGGAREPSDDLVLVGELSKVTATAPPAGSASTAMAAAPSASAPAAAPAPTPAPAPAAETASAAVTAAIPPPPARGPDGQLVRVFPASVDRSWTVVQSVLRSLGWDIDEANQATGFIRTEPRNVTFKDFVVYGEGTRHTLDVVVRPVSGNETSISVKRRVFEEQRIFWTKERKALPAPESSVEQTVLDAISRLL